MEISILFSTTNQIAPSRIDTITADSKYVLINLLAKNFKI